MESCEGQGIPKRLHVACAFTIYFSDVLCKLAVAIDTFTVDRTGDLNGVFETMRHEIFDFRIFCLSLHIARFLCINVLEPDEIQ